MSDHNPKQLTFADLTSSLEHLEMLITARGLGPIRHWLDHVQAQLDVYLLIGAQQVSVPCRIIADNVRQLVRNLKDLAASGEMDLLPAGVSDLRQLVVAHHRANAQPVLDSSSPDSARHSP